MERLGLDERDVIVLSDADEVMSRESAGVLKHCEWTPQAEKHTLALDAIAPMMSTHYFGLDHHGSNLTIGTTAVRASLVHRLGSVLALTARNLGLVVSAGGFGVWTGAVAAGGWHMSFFLSAHAAARKMAESNHMELVGSRTGDRGRIEACMVSGWDAWGRPTSPFESFSDAAAKQTVFSTEEYELVYGRVPRLMLEHPDVFGQRRPWMPGGLRRQMTRAALEALEAQCRSTGGK